MILRPAAAKASAMKRIRKLGRAYSRRDAAGAGPTSR